MHQEFKITYVTRSDLLEITGDLRVGNPSDETMDYFASSLAEEYDSGQFVADVRELWERRFSPDVASKNDEAFEPGQVGKSSQTSTTLDKEPGMVEIPDLILSANDGAPLLRKAVRLFRHDCKHYPDTSWLPAKQLLRKEHRDLHLPLSWTVTIPERGVVSITPDEIIGFKVDGSSSRILLLCGDHINVPVQSESGDSLFLRTQALVAARDGSSPGKDKAQTYLRSSRFLIVWILENANRVQELKRLCEEHSFSNILLTDEETFLATQNRLGIEWEQVGYPAHTII